MRLQETFAGNRPYGQKELTWRFLQRVHYRMEIKIPAASDHGALPHYYTVHDEVIAGFGPNNGHQSLKQNRAYGALGWNLRNLCAG